MDGNADTGTDAGACAEMTTTKHKHTAAGNATRAPHGHTELRMRATDGMRTHTHTDLQMHAQHKELQVHARTDAYFLNTIVCERK